MILSRLRRGERIDHYETVRVNKEGRRMEVSLTISPVRDGAGRVIGASRLRGILRRRKRAEQRIRTQYRVTQTLGGAEDLRTSGVEGPAAICQHPEWQSVSFGS